MLTEKENMMSSLGYDHRRTDVTAITTCRRECKKEYVENCEVLKLFDLKKNDQKTVAVPSFLYNFLFFHEKLNLEEFQKISKHALVIDNEYFFAYSFKDFIVLLSAECNNHMLLRNKIGQKVGETNNTKEAEDNLEEFIPLQYEEFKRKNERFLNSDFTSEEKKCDLDECYLPSMNFNKPSTCSGKKFIENVLCISADFLKINNPFCKITFEDLCYSYGDAKYAEYDSGCFYVNNLNSYIFTFVEECSKKLIIALFPIYKYGFNKQRTALLRFSNYEVFIKRLFKERNDNMHKTNDCKYVNLRNDEEKIYKKKTNKNILKETKERFDISQNAYERKLFMTILKKHIKKNKKYDMKKIFLKSNVAISTLKKNYITNQSYYVYHLLLNSCMNILTNARCSLVYSSNNGVASGIGDKEQNEYVNNLIVCEQQKLRNAVIVKNADDLDSDSKQSKESGGGCSSEKSGRENSGRENSGSSDSHSNRENCGERNMSGNGDSSSGNNDDDDNNQNNDRGNEDEDEKDETEDENDKSEDENNNEKEKTEENEDKVEEKEKKKSILEKENKNDLSNKSNIEKTIIDKGNMLSANITSRNTEYECVFFNNSSNSASYNSDNFTNNSASNQLTISNNNSEETSVNNYSDINSSSKNSMENVSEMKDTQKETMLVKKSNQGNATNVEKAKTKKMKNVKSLEETELVKKKNKVDREEATEAVEKNGKETMEHNEALNETENTTCTSVISDIMQKENDFVEQDERSNVSVKLKEENIQGDVPLKKKLSKKVNKRKIEKNAKDFEDDKKEVLTKVSQVTRVGGVCFDKNRQRWIAHWKIDGKYHKHYFPISQYGFENAREKAVNCRKQAEKQFNLPEIQPRNRCNQMRVNTSPYVKRALKLPRCDGVGFDEMSQSWVSTYVVHKKFSVDEYGFYGAREKAIFCRKTFEKVNSHGDYKELLTNTIGANEEEQKALNVLLNIDVSKIEEIVSKRNTKTSGNKMNSDSITGSNTNSRNTYNINHNNNDDNKYINNDNDNSKINDIYNDNNNNDNNNNNNNNTTNNNNDTFIHNSYTQVKNSVMKKNYGKMNGIGNINECTNDKVDDVKDGENAELICDRNDHLKVTQEAIEMILKNIKHKTLPEIKMKLEGKRKFENYDTLLDKHFKFITSAKTVGQLRPYISLFHSFIVCHTLPQNMPFKEQLFIVEALECSSFFSKANK